MPKRKFLFLIADAILIIFAIYLAFLLRFEGQIPERHLQNMFGMIVLSLISCILIFYFFRLYSFSWTYVSTTELISLTKAQALSLLFLSATIFLLRDWAVFTGFPRSTLFLSFILIFFFCGGLRFSKRIYLQIFSVGKVTKKEKVLIVGAGDVGEKILRSIMSFKFSPYLPVGFIDDNKEKQGIVIHGIKVLGTINDIPKAVKAQNITGGTMIVALPSAGSRIIRMAVEKGKEAGFKKIKIVPSIEEVINGTISIGMLKEVGMEDLLSIDFLGKEPISLDQNAIKDFIQNKKILITGAAGSIGSELCRQIAKFNPSLILMLDQDETGIFNISEEMFDNFPELNIQPIICDILDDKKLEQIFAKFSPQVVFHAAAYKHVPLMEIEPEEAIKNNVFGTKKVAEIAQRYKTEKFIFISTDKAVKPTSVMGVSKRIGEMICQALNDKNETKFISVRFGNVLDSRGSVTHIFREQIKRGGPVEITHPDMKRYFMTNSEACLLVMQASAMGRGGEVFVLDMGKPIKILDLAKKMIELSGFEPEKDIPIVFTKPRPGEKIFEEILTTEEEIMATQNQKIFFVKLPVIENEKLNSSLNKLKEAVDSADKENIIKILREIIPFYNPL